MSEILVNDIFDELREENQRLANELSFERNLNEILENIKNYSLILKNNCICAENIEIFKKLNDFEIDYKILKSKQKSIKSELNSSFDENPFKPNTSGIQISNVTSLTKSHQKDGPKSRTNSSNDVRPQLICNECNNKLSTALELVLHINRYHKQIDSYVCPECKQVFESKDLFSSHLLEHQTNGEDRRSASKSKPKTITDYLRSYRRPISSGNIPETIPRERIIKKENHLRLITEMLKPRESSEQTDNSSTLLSVNDIKIESNNHSSRGIQCPECQLRSNSEEALEIHIKKNHSSLVCSKCDQMFYSKEDVFNHLSSIHKIKGKIYCCFTCDYKTPSKYCYERHKRTKACTKGGYKCSNMGCNCTFINSVLLSKHKKKCQKRQQMSSLKTQHKEDSLLTFHEINGQLVCHLCPFKTKVRFHMNRHHSTCHSGNRPFKCDINGCNNAYKRKTHLNEHKKRIHKRVESIPSEDIYLEVASQEIETPEGVSPEDDLSDGTSQMSLLKKLTQNLRSVSKTDFSQESKEEDFNEELIVSGNIERDIKLELISDSDNESNIVQNSTERPDIELVSDNKNEKTSDDKYFCKLCRFRTNNKIYLSLHEMQDHPEVRPYKCDFPNCDKSYTRADSLSKHKRVTHKRSGHKNKEKESHENSVSDFSISSEGKLFECNVCHYKTQFHHLLSKHMSSHSPDRPFKCDFEGCVFSARRKDTLKTHQRGVHKLGKPQFICNYPNCRRGFESEIVLKQHYNSHKNRFLCRWEGCQFRTDTFAKLNEHRRNENHMPPQLS